MTTRRDHGSGTMVEVRPGVWRLRVYVGRDPATGHARQASRTVRGGKREASRALAAFISERTDMRVSGPDATLAQLLAQWMEHLRQRGSPPTTLAAYGVVCRRLGADVLGPTRLRVLRAHDIDRYYERRLRAGAAPAGVRLDHAVLSAALHQAQRWERIAASPMGGVTPPRVERPDAPSLTPGQVRALVVAADEEGRPHLAMAVVLAAVTGARRGELCGLRWSDVDWDGRRILIERARKPARGGDITGSTKGRNRRWVAVEERVMAALARYRLLQEERADTLGIPMDPDGWLISPDAGMRPITVGALTSAVRKLGQRAGVPLHLHELRHYAGSELVGAGVDVRTVAGRLGHSPQVLLQVYAHRLPERDRAAAGLLESLVLGPALET